MNISSSRYTPSNETDDLTSALSDTLIISTANEVLHTQTYAQKSLNFKHSRANCHAKSVYLTGKITPCCTTPMKITTSTPEDRNSHYFSIPCFEKITPRVVPMAAAFEARLGRAYMACFVLPKIIVFQNISVDGVTYSLYTLFWLQTIQVSKHIGVCKIN